VQRDIIKGDLEKLQASIKSDKGKAALAKVEEARNAYIGGQNKFLELMKANRQGEAKTLLLEEIRPQQATYVAEVGKLVDMQTERMHEIGTEANKAVQSALILIIVLAIIAVLAGIVIGLMIVRGLMKQLGGEPDYAADAVGQNRPGDLSINLDIKPGDTSSLIYSLKTMQDSLRSIVAEIQGIVQAANKGDFSIKMNMNGKAGYTKDLSELLNQLSNTVDGAFNDTIRVAEALSKGDLSQKVTTEYAGAYNQVKVSVNTTADSLTQIVGEIQQIVEAATKGDFSIKMNLTGKQGYTKTLSDLLNLLSDTVDTAFKDTIRVAQCLAKAT